MLITVRKFDFNLLEHLNLLSYEYHQTNDSLPKGYIYGLFTLQDENLETIKN